MAHLVKEAKRGKPLPRIVDGSLYTGAKVDWRPSCPGMLHADSVFHTLDVTAGYGGDTYQLQLTDIEMLKVVSEWLEQYHRQQEEKLNGTKSKS